jgi:endonuclease/exonuclease/phosphatase family metal-dependent hydrolase
MSKKQRRRKRENPRPISNDNLSRYLRDFIPDEFEGDDRFLDLITWNIKFFNNRDPKRVENIRIIMQELNADLFILQEIEEDSLDEVAEALTFSGAGLYKAVYGTTGGDQRVAFLYDMEWVKASSNLEELFESENLTVSADGMDKPVFPRLPLHNTFVAHREEEPFDFHLVGVHLKSQRGGGQEQRTAAAQRLAKWVTSETTDEDIIIAGDWNAPPERPEWEAFRELESQKVVKFLGLNKIEDKVTEASHLSVGGRRSRLDLIVVSEATDPALFSSKATVINWNALLESRNAPSLLKEVIDTISDHLPVLTRFYFTDLDKDDQPDDR